MKLTGGGIVHIQIATQTTPQQNEQLIKFACAEGCEHFAFLHENQRKPNVGRRWSNICWCIGASFYLTHDRTYCGLFYALNMAINCFVEPC